MTVISGCFSSLMSITGAALLSTSTFEFVRIGSEFSVVMVTRCRQERSVPTTKAALRQFYEKDTILFALLRRAVHPRQRRGNAPEQLKANQRSFGDVSAETPKGRNRAGSSPVHTWPQQLKDEFYSQRFQNNRKGWVSSPCEGQIRLLTLPV